MQNENLPPNNGPTPPASGPIVPNSTDSTSKKSLKPWMIGLGALGLVVVVGLAVSLSQGGLFQGQLTLRQSASTLSTSTDFSAEVKEKGLNLSQKVWQVKVNERDYEIMVDGRAAAAFSAADRTALQIDNAVYEKAGLGNDLYLKISPVRETTAIRQMESVDNTVIAPATSETTTTTTTTTTNVTTDATRTQIDSSSLDATDATRAETVDLSTQVDPDSTSRTEAEATMAPSTSEPTQELIIQKDEGSTDMKATEETTLKVTTMESTQMVDEPMMNSTSREESTTTIKAVETTPTATEDSSTDLKKLESSLIGIAHAAISKEMACQIDKNYVVKCSDITGYPNNLYNVNVNNVSEFQVTYGLRVVNSGCKDFDGLRFDPAEIAFNDKDTAYSTKMYAYLGSDEFSVEDICRASLREMGAEKGLMLKISEASDANNFAQSNMIVSDMSKDQTLLNGFVTASQGGELKLDLAKTAVGGSIATLKASTEYNLQVFAKQKALSPVLKIKSVAGVAVGPEVTAVPGTLDSNAPTVTAVSTERDINCSNLDRLAFAPTSLSYTEGEANSVVSTTLSGYEGKTEIGIPFDQRICSEAIANLQLEGSGLYVEVMNEANKTTTTQLLDMSDDTLDKMGQQAILDGFNLFNGVMNVKLTQNEDKQIKLVFSNDLSKRDLGNKFIMVAGQEYRVNLRGVLLKDSKAGQFASNYTPGDKILTSYSLKINERPVPDVTQQENPVVRDEPEKPVVRDEPVTERSAEPCLVDGRTYYLAEGPNSAYCRDLQALSTVLRTDQAPETPQVRYTTALAVQRIINEIIEEKDLDASFRVRNITSTWYSSLVDGSQIANVSAQEMADFRNVYATGILKGRINPKDRSEVTLAPLDQVTYAELLSILRQAVASVLGVNPVINDNNLPTFLLNEYRQNPDMRWVAEAVSFGVEYNIIVKDEFNRETLFSVANRSDMASYLNKFKEAIDANSALISR